jgi:predicted nucleic acid-binding Zn finger protein
VTGVDDDRDRGGEGGSGDDADADADPAHGDDDIDPDLTHDSAGDPGSDDHGSDAASIDDDTGDASADESDDTAPADDTPDPREDWQAALAAEGRLTAAIVDAIVSRHGDRGRRAIEAVSEGRVKQYRDFTVVVGHDDEYVVEAGGCTCKDAEYNLSPDDPDQRCWHAIAVDVAEGVGAVDHHDMWYSEVREFL